MPPVDANFEALFRKLYETYHYALKAHARHYTGSAAIAEDMVQDTFLQLWEIRTEFDFSRSVKTWLYHTVHNMCINHIRHQQVEGKYREIIQLKIREAELFNPEMLENQPDLLSDKEFEVRLRSAVGRMPDRCREALLLSREAGLTNRQIAEEMRISVKAVERNMTRALGLLRDVFRDLLTIFLIFSHFI